MSPGSTPPAPHVTPGKSGMTLIEILVALSVSTLVLTVALSIYFTFAGSFRRLGDPRHREITTALDSIRHDLTSSLQAAFTNDPTFDLESVPVGLEGRFQSTLTFHTANIPPGDQSLPKMTITRLCYRLQDNPLAPPAATLFRESVTLWGPDAMAQPVSNALIHDVLGFEVKVLDSNGWTNRLKSTTAHLVPRAARVRLDWQGARATETASLIVFIPAGNNIPAPARTNQPVKGRTTPAPADTAAPTPAPPRASGKTDPRVRP